MGEEVRVNSEMYCGNQEDYDALKMAVKQLSSVSQEQFETIKKNGTIVFLIWLLFHRKAGKELPNR